MPTLTTRKREILVAEIAIFTWTCLFIVFVRLNDQIDISAKAEETYSTSSAYEYEFNSIQEQIYADMHQTETTDVTNLYEGAAAVTIESETSLVRIESDTAYANRPTSIPTAVPATPTPTTSPNATAPTGSGHLTRSGGVYNGPSGRETYYNLNMNLIIQYMRDLGYSEEEYPYWVREDGCKMFGDYIMVAANLSTRPKGTILETSLGTAIVVDTGSFVNTYPDGIDIAVTW